MGQLVILVGAAVVAGYQAWEARRLRKEQARPFVVVDFEPERPPVMNLVITNLGKTMARNVRIDADPRFQSSQDESHPESLAQLKIFADGIPALAPGETDRSAVRSPRPAAKGTAEQLLGHGAVRVG